MLRGGGGGGGGDEYVPSYAVRDAESNCDCDEVILAEPRGKLEAACLWGTFTSLILCIDRDMITVCHPKKHTHPLTSRIVQTIAAFDV